jgi:outer membrane immunogenic protein
MKKLLVAAITAAAFSAPALAAPPAAPIFNWAGFYVGATAGAAWSTADVSLNPVNGAVPNYRRLDIPGVIALGTHNFYETIAIFGGKIGYNQQLSAWVIGLEADLSSLRLKKSITVTGNPFPGFGGSMTLNTSVSSSCLATVRPRIGYAVDRTLFYATGGLSFGKVSFSNTDNEFSPSGLGFGNEASAASKVKAGWAAGAGVDYSLTRNWIVSIEYLHVDLGSLHASGLVTSGNTATAALNFATKLRSDIARAGVSYKF